jgi:cell division protein FtsB
MRHSKAIVAAGNVRSSAHPIRRTIVVLMVAVIAAWAAYAFAQEAYISQRLSQQVADLHSQNARLAAQNNGYSRDVQSVANGAASEEEARNSGYARAGEHVYLLTSPSPTPTKAAASPTP